jgi:biofilm PGA synthesis protein PgaD
MKEVIIDQPQWQTLRQRVVFGSMTALFWALWVYLWLPLLAFIGWVLGLKITYDEMVARAGYIELVHRLGLYSFVVFCLGASLLTWAYYNYFRFHGRERRKRRPSVSLGDLAKRYEIAPSELERWMLAPRLLVHHNSDGRIRWAELSPGQAAAPTLVQPPTC